MVVGWDGLFSLSFPPRRFRVKERMGLVLSFVFIVVKEVCYEMVMMSGGQEITTLFCYSSSFVV